MFTKVLFILEKHRNPHKCPVRRNGYLTSIIFINGILCIHKNNTHPRMYSFMVNRSCYRKCEEKDNYNFLIYIEKIFQTTYFSKCYCLFQMATVHV